MEIIQQGRYWIFKNTHGPVPNELKGLWNSYAAAHRQLEAFQAMVRSRALNVSERQRRKDYARKNAATTA